MFKVNYYGGTLYCDSNPLLTFKFEEDRLVSVKELVSTKTLYPFEFRKVVNDKTLRLFLENRTTPSSRQGLLEELQKTPMPFYNPEWLLRYSNARTCDDNFWIKPDSDTRGLGIIEESKWNEFIS